MSELEFQLPDCRNCQHYFITWDVNFPCGCRAMDFKSKRLPHLDVLESSGHPCLKYQAKPMPRLS